MPLAGTRLLPRQISAVSFDAGWASYDRLVVAVAVALAESSGYERAYNVNPDGSIDRGLYEINNEAHPEVSDDAAYNAASNAQAAHRIYVDAGYSFRPWAAYTNRAYESHLGTAVVGAANFMAQRLSLTPVPYVTRSSI